MSNIIDDMSRDDHLKARMFSLRKTQIWKRKIIRAANIQGKQTNFYVGYHNKNGSVTFIANNLLPVETDYTDILLDELCKIKEWKE